MIRKLFIVFIISLLSLFASGQTTKLLREGIEKQSQIGIDDLHTNNINSQVIEAISGAAGFVGSSKELSYKFKEHHSIYKINNKLELKIAIGNFIKLDNIIYKDFSLNSFLQPDLVSCNVFWKDDKGEVLKTKNIKKAHFVNGADLFHIKLNDTYNRESYQLYLEDIAFEFGKNKLTELETFIKLVDSYYSADAHLKLIEANLDKIVKDSLEMLEAYKQQTDDNENVFKQIKSKRYVSKLNLDAKDPIYFKSHFGRLEVKNRDIKKELVHITSNMHVAYYKKGLVWLERNDKVNAKELFEQSISAKHNYSQPYLELAKLEDEKGNNKQAIDTCAKIIREFSPDSDTRYETIKLAEKIIGNWISSMNKSLQTGNYNNVARLLAQAEKYTNSIQGVRKFSELQQIREELLVSAYKNMIQKAENYIADSKVKEATLEIDSLAVLREKYEAYITDLEPEHNLLLNIYESWEELAQIYLDKQKPDSAMYACEQARAICVKYTVVKCSYELEGLTDMAVKQTYEQFMFEAYAAVQNQWADSALYYLSNAEKVRKNYNLTKNSQYDDLLVQANQYKYNDLILGGKQAFRQNFSREALAFYNEALDIEKLHQVNKNTTLANLISEAAINYILDLCVDGNYYIDNQDINKARQKLQLATEFSSKYELQNNADVQKSIATLKSKLDSGKCQKAEYDYTIQISAAKKFIESKEFVFASNALLKAKSVSKNNADCALDNAQRKQIENEISSMLHYQKEMERIDNQIDEKDYEEAVENYVVLTKFYNDSCTNNFGILHKPLFKFIIEHRIGMFIDYSVQYYTKQSKPDTALLLLKELKEREYIASWSKESQTLLGAYLARIDFDANPDYIYEEQLSEYTDYSKWYKYLKKSYIQEWKKLKGL